MTTVSPGLPVRDKHPWLDFSLAELMEALAQCSGRSAPGPDHLTWTHLKHLLVRKEVTTLFLWIANACLQAGTWPKELKVSKTVVIPKLGKPSYDVPKAFRPIVLLNTMGKLLEKMIANCLQFEAAKEGILHPCQFGGVCQNSTENAGIYLTHLVCTGWAKGLKTSVVAFDLAQYFPSLQHGVIITLLKCMGFAMQVCDFFVDYLVGRSMRYAWEGELSPPFETSVGVGQGSALSPILSALYLTPILWQASLEAPEAALMSYVDDGTIIVQSKTWDANLTKLRSTYGIVFELTQALGLVLEHDKLEVFHFSRKSGDTNPLVDLGYAPFTGDSLLRPNTYWRYLDFFFDWSPSFQEHSRRYSTKALTTVKAMVSMDSAPKTSGFCIVCASFQSLHMVLSCGTMRVAVLRAP